MGTGPQVMAAIMEEDVTALAGPKGRLNRDRSVKGHGSDDWS